MGRTQPSRGLAPPAVRKDARAKHAKATLNKTIPAILASDSRARKGVDSASLVVASQSPGAQTPKSSKGGRRSAAKPIGQRPVAEVPVAAKPLVLKVISCDFVTAAMRLNDQPYLARDHRVPKSQRSNARIGILNPASPLRPGGGFLTGAQAGEEFLCLRTTLLPSLREEFYRLPEVGGVLTRDVLVFRDGEGNDLEKRARFYVDVVSAGMLRMPEVERAEEDVHVPTCGSEQEQTSRGQEESDGDETEPEDGDDNRQENEAEIEDDYDANGRNRTQRKAGREDNESNASEESPVGEAPSTKIIDTPAPKTLSTADRTRYASPSDRVLVLRKMRSVLQTFQTAGCTHLVLCAWGCGAYGNPVGEVARAWRTILLGDEERIGSGRRRTGVSSRESWDGIEEVVFAIRDPQMAEDFAKYFGGQMRVESVSTDEYGGDEDEGSEEGGHSEQDEVRAKIEDLELQYRQIRNPDLKARVGETIIGLKRSRDREIVEMN